MSSYYPTWFLTRGALAGICQVYVYITSHNIVTILLSFLFLFFVIVAVHPFCSCCCCLFSLFYKVFQGETVVDPVDSMFLLLLMFL